MLTKIVTATASAACPVEMRVEVKPLYGRDQWFDVSEKANLFGFRLLENPAVPPDEVWIESGLKVTRFKITGDGA